MTEPYCPAATRLWARTRALATAEFGLAMTPPGPKRADNSWIVVKGDLPDHVQLDWKVAMGRAGLSIDKRHARHRPPGEVDLAGLDFPVRWRATATQLILEHHRSPRRDADWADVTDGTIRRTLARLQALHALWFSAILAPDPAAARCAAPGRRPAPPAA